MGRIDVIEYKSIINDTVVVEVEGFKIGDVVQVKESEGEFFYITGFRKGKVNLHPLTNLDKYEGKYPYVDLQNLIETPCSVLKGKEIIILAYGDHYFAKYQDSVKVKEKNNFTMSK